MKKYLFGDELMVNKDELKQCTVVLTHNCNLRCDFCYVKGAGYNVDDNIKYENLKNIVDFCCEADMKYIFFTGGEPLMYPYLTDILNYIREKEKLVSAIASNGILLEDVEFCKRLVDSGLGYIDISMKGSNAFEWIKTTGFDGTFPQLKAIRNLSSMGMEFTCSMVITHQNVKCFCDAVQIAYENGARQFSFTFVIDNNNINEKNQEYLIKNNPFSLIALFVSQIERLNAITDDWWIEYSFPMCIYTEEQLSMLEGRLATPCQVHMKNAITINTKMELLPCDMYIDKKMGKFGIEFFLYQDFDRVVNNPKNQHLMKKLREWPSEKCTSCKYLNACYGGCPVLWKNYSFEALAKAKESYYSKQGNLL